MARLGQMDPCILLAASLGGTPLRPVLLTLMKQLLCCEMFCREAAWRGAEGGL